MHTRIREIEKDIERLENKKGDIYKKIIEGRDKGEDTRLLDKAWIAAGNKIDKKKEALNKEHKKVGYSKDPLEILNEELRLADYKNKAIDILQSRLKDLREIKKDLYSVIRLDNNYRTVLMAEIKTIDSIIYNINNHLGKKADKKEIQKRIKAERKRQDDIINKENEQAQILKELG